MDKIDNSWMNTLYNTYQENKYHITNFTGGKKTKCFLKKKKKKNQDETFHRNRGTVGGDGRDACEMSLRTFLGRFVLDGIFVWGLFWRKRRKRRFGRLGGSWLFGFWHHKSIAILCRRRLFGRGNGDEFCGFGWGVSRLGVVFFHKPASGFAFGKGRGMFTH